MSDESMNTFHDLIVVLREAARLRVGLADYGDFGLNAVAVEDAVNVAALAAWGRVMDAVEVTS